MEMECSFCSESVGHCAWCGGHVPREQLVGGLCSDRCRRAEAVHAVSVGPLAHAAADEANRERTARQRLVFCAGAMSASMQRDLEAALAAVGRAARRAYRDALDAADRGEPA